MPKNWILEYPKRVGKHVIAILPSLFSLGEECDDFNCMRCHPRVELSQEQKEWVTNVVAECRSAMEAYKQREKQLQFNF